MKTKGPQIIALMLCSTMHILYKVFVISNGGSGLPIFLVLMSLWIVLIQKRWALVLFNVISIGLACFFSLGVPFALYQSITHPTYDQSKPIYAMVLMSLIQVATVVVINRSNK